MDTKRLLVLLMSAMMLMLMALPAAAAKSNNPGEGRGPGVKDRVTGAGNKPGRVTAPGVTVTFSGKRFRNKHVVRALIPSVEIIIGWVSGRDASGITMDGEYFRISGAELVDKFGNAFTMSEVHVGMKVHIRKTYGAIDKVIAYKMARKTHRGKDSSRKIDDDALPPGPDGMPAKR